MLTPDDESYNMKSRVVMRSVLFVGLCGFLSGSFLADGFHTKDHFEAIMLFIAGGGQALGVVSMYVRARRDLRKRSVRTLPYDRLS
jgi:hypothetical protein